MADSIAEFAAAATAAAAVTAPDSKMKRRIFSLFGVIHT